MDRNDSAGIRWSDFIRWVVRKENEETAPPKDKVKTAWICLGRYGDICNMLPLVLYDYQQGNRPTLVVGSEWAGILDGVSYCDVLKWSGKYSAPLEAAKWVRFQKHFDEVYIPQCYGQTFAKQCSNFCEEAWRLAGFDHLWGRLPLVFDRRNPIREQALVPKTNKPLILLHSSGISSPFPQSEQLKESLNPIRDTHEIVDLNQVNAFRFFDLIGLYEKAQYLVATDSGPLHLAQAVPSLKVIALITHLPTPWHGTAERPNHVLRIRYDEFPSRMLEIPETIKANRGIERRFIHVWSDYYRRDAGVIRRHMMAKKTWTQEMKGWIDLALKDKDFDRDSRTDYDDFRCAPYVTDMIEKAAAVARAWDIIVITNDDTCVCPHLEKILRDVVPQFGACWSARREHSRINHLFSTTELMRGRKHVGADLFAFTKEWWEEYGHNMPDMFMAFENWDYVFRTVINSFGGREVEGLCYHEMHKGEWTKNRECAAAKHNQHMGGKFFEANRV